MANHHLDRLARDRAIEQSLMAAMEVNEVLRKKRRDAPALVELISTLIGHQDPKNLQLKHDLLSDAQFASLSSRAARLSGHPYSSSSELDRILSLLLEVNTLGLSNFREDDLSFIRDFCLGLNTVFVEELASRNAEPPLARARRPILADLD